MFNWMTFFKFDLIKILNLFRISKSKRNLPHIVYGKLIVHRNEKALIYSVETYFIYF